MACAPLIFFFNYYGQQKSVPESIDIARQLYWYALADKSEDSKKVLPICCAAGGSNKTIARP
jgi:hypothetical protein